jgi:hypothetical protein
VRNRRNIIEYAPAIFTSYSVVLGINPKASLDGHLRPRRVLSQSHRFILIKAIAGELKVHGVCDEEGWTGVSSQSHEDEVTFVPFRLE